MKFDLLVERWKKVEDSDIYILVYGQDHKYKMLGWMWAVEIIKECNIDNTLKSPAYRYKQDRLNSVDYDRLKSITRNDVENAKIYNEVCVA